MSRQMCLSVSFFGSATALAVALSSFAQDRPVTESVWIYTDVPAAGQDDRRGEIEKYFAPYYFAPARKASDIVSDPFFEAKKLQANATGTCLELKFSFDGPNQWAQVGFFPADTVALGDTPARTDIETTLNPRPDDKIFLEFKARRPANEQSIVSFRCGGLAGSGARDGLLPPAKRDPDFDALTADWTTYRIDLTEYRGRLNSVLCAFIVTCESNRNKAIKRLKPDGELEKKSSILVYVDDVRFIKVPRN